MTYWLSLWIEGKEVEHISTALGMANENMLLETVFPEEYWNAAVPRSYDFTTNEARTEKAIHDFLERTRSDVHLASPREMQAVANEFAKEFMRVFNTGMASQREGKEVKVQIST
jgi:uncharacterized protein YfkK (UPF0435 family)